MNAWNIAVPQPDQLGESPFWHPREGRLYWVDIQGRAVNRLDPATGDVERWAMPAEPGCIAPADGGGLVVALRDGVWRAPDWGGPLRLLVRAPYDPATSRFNDGKADPQGRFWAGSLYDPRDAQAAALYCLDLQAGAGRMERKAGEATVANGLAWSPDARTMYWADTSQHVVWAWDWDASSNAMSNQRVFLQFPGKPDGWKPGDAGYGGRPDGAAIDAQGNYWCAMYEGGRVLQFAPSGRLLREIPVPVRCPTMPCFGGADLQTLYLTTARHSRTPEELREQPRAGCVFAMQVDVAGRPVDFVRD
ncbi:MAG TPA: SMP-30/gluconolactonase/LRE family protein [Ramlibacter sp.]